MRSGFRRGEDPATASTPATIDIRNELDEPLTNIAGPPGTTWTIPVPDLRQAFTTTSHFLDLHHLSTPTHNPAQ